MKRPNHDHGRLIFMTVGSLATRLRELTI